jgi:hypothetical protein
MNIYPGVDFVKLWSMEMLHEALFEKDGRNAIKEIRLSRDRPTAGGIPWKTWNSW